MRRAKPSLAVQRPDLQMRYLRKAKGLSQMDVADLLDKDQSAIARWERGEAEPRLSELLALAQIYGCALGDLVAGGDGLTDEERTLIGFLRANPVHRKILLSQLTILKETVPTTMPD